MNNITAIVILSTLPLVGGAIAWGVMSVYRRIYDWHFWRMWDKAIARDKTHESYKERNNLFDAKLDNTWKAEWEKANGLEPGTWDRTQNSPPDGVTVEKQYTVEEPVAWKWSSTAEYADNYGEPQPMVASPEDYGAMLGEAFKGLKETVEHKITLGKDLAKKPRKKAKKTTKKSKKTKK